MDVRRFYWCWFSYWFTTNFKYFAQPAIKDKIVPQVLNGEKEYV